MTSFYAIMIFVIVFIAIMVIASITTPDRKSREKKETLSKNITDEDILNEIKKGNKIAAIKFYRERHKVGLKEAKEAIDKLESDYQS